MFDFTVKLAIFAVLLQLTTSLSIREIIQQRQELSTLAQYMRESEYLKELGYSSSPTKYTFFAPHNDAFNMIPAEINQRYGMSPSTLIRKEFDNIMKYHTVYSFDGSNVLFSNNFQNGETPYQSMATGSPNMFLSQMGSNYYMNGARIMEPDIQASNGVIHIIDHFHHDIGRSMNMYKFLDNNRQGSSDRESTRKFMELLDQYEQMSQQSDPGSLNALRYFNHHDRMTLFVPTNEAINAIPAQDLGLLRGNNEQLKQVIESHLMIDRVQHANLLAQSLNQPMNALYGQITPRRFGNDMYVSSNCVQGRLGYPNITLTNGVVHMVDSVLGFLYNDAHQQLERDDSVNRFFGHVRSSSSDIENLLRMSPGLTGEVPVSQQVTVFAPINSAFSDIDLTQDSDLLNNVMRTHMMSGRLELDDMLDGVERDTYQQGMRARFYRGNNGQDVYVEADRVRARIVASNICVKNGIIHKIDRVLGYTDRTIMDVIESDPQLSSLYKTVVNAGLTSYLSDRNRRITMFVPIDEAFESMRQGIQGQRLLDSRNSLNMRNVLNRHMLQGELYTDSVTSRKRELQTMFDKINIVRRGDQEYYVMYGSEQIQLTKYDIRCANGVLHYMGAVMYSENPNASEWINAAGTSYISLVLLITAQIAVLLK